MFTAKDVQALTDAAKVPQKCRTDDLGRSLAQFLDEAAEAFLRDQFFQNTASPSSLSKRLSAIEGAAKALLKKLQTSDKRVDADLRSLLIAQANASSSNIEPDKISSGREQLRTAIESTANIAAWSHAAKKRVDRRKGRVLGHAGDPAMQRLIGDLNGAWLAFFDSFPGASLNDISNTIGGPYIRFVQAFLECVKSKLSPEELEANPGLNKALSSSAAAIRERLQGTGITSIVRLIGGGRSEPQKS
jgi:hypothetical protein